MPGDPRPWNPKQWEQHIQRLLKKRYAHPPGSYQEVPDTVKGDAGVEGFAADGTAYQCYAAQQWTNTADLLAKQRNKITVDIHKFVTKEAELVTIFGAVKICQWNLVAPYWNNKDLIKHANIKAAEVKKKRLKHVANTFRISILTADDFAVEVQLLANINLYRFDIAAPPVPPEELANWMAGKNNLEMVANLSHKAALIGAGRSQQAKERFQARMVANYIGGSIVLGRLERSSPRSTARWSNTKSLGKRTLKPKPSPRRKSPRSFLKRRFNNTVPNLLVFQA